MTKGDVRLPDGMYDVDEQSGCRYLRYPLHSVIPAAEYERLLPINGHMPGAPQAVPAQVGPAAPPETPIAGLSKGELSVRCAEAGIEVPARATKDDLIALLEAAMAASDEDSGDEDSGDGE